VVKPSQCLGATTRARRLPSLADLFPRATNSITQKTCTLLAIRRFGMILKLQIGFSKPGIKVLKHRIEVFKLQIEVLKL
jgi:hypothetical protein